MASTRMNTSIREAILTKLLVRAFSDEIAKIGDRETALADKIYNDCYNQQDRNTIASLKEGWLVSSDRLQVNFAGQRIKLGLGKPLWEFCQTGIEYKLRKDIKREPVERRFAHAHKDGYYATVKSYTADHKLAEEYQRLQQDTESLIQRINTHASEARAVLNSVTTVQKLVKVWPEVEPLATHWMRDEAREIVTGLPAVQMDKLNEALRLPPGGEEEAA